MSRKIPLHLVALVAILGHSTADAQHSPGKNLILSAGFEGPIANFPKWHTKDQQFENDGCIYCGPTTEMAFRGKQSCKIQTTGTRGDCLRYVCTDIKPGKAYRYEFHYQIKSGGIYISPEGGLPQFFRLEGPTQEWKKFSVVFVADETKYVATIGNFRRQKPNLIYIDDIKLIELPKLPEEFTPRPFRIEKLPARPHRPARHTTLLAHFDEVVGLDERHLANIRSPGVDPKSPLFRPNADYARWNPLSAGRDTLLVPGGRFGKAVAVTAPRACVIFGGEENCPTTMGTVEFHARSAGGQNIWADGKEHWFTYLGRSRVNDVVGGGGFTLEFSKNARNHLVLSCGRGRRIEIPTAKLDPAAWHHILFGWNLKTHRMYLAINGQGLSTAMPLPLAAGEFSTFLLGNHPTLDQPAGCLIDELVVTDRPPTDRSPVAGRALPTPRRPQPQNLQSTLAGKGLAKLDLNEAFLLTTERRVRLWLDRVIRAQRGGGWATTVDNVRWPSMLLGGYDRLCIPRGQVTFGKTYNTSHTAMHLCFAHEAIGDQYYLDAARRTAEMYLEIQAVTRHERFGTIGRWPRTAYVIGGRTIPGHGLDDVMIQDFYVTGPTLTLLYVHKLTGRKDFLEGAIRGGNFLLLAQNPNGSWPHHFEWNQQAGYGTGSANGPGGRSLRHGSELNDNATTDAIRTLVALWHWTRDGRYLEAIRRAADWVVAAQLGAPTFGWAAQYDSNDVPAWARAHEPPAAVWGNGALMASNALFLAHRLTGDPKYLDPLDRYLAALEKIRTPEGWYQTYDYKNGRPIAARAGKVYYLDDPKQSQAYQDAGGGSTGYWKRGAMSLEEHDLLKRTLAAARLGEFLPTIRRLKSRNQVIAVLKREMANKEYIRDVDLMARRRWIPEEGLWVSTANKFDAGPAFSPCQERTVRFTLRVCHLARAALGEVPLEQLFPLGGRIMDHRYHVVPKPAEFFNTPLRKRSD